MPQLILASQSAQRSKLLKGLGLKFKVIPSGAREIQKITTTCSQLVQDNALLKARDVASRLKQGVVIGADTLVYLGNGRIVGKPKTLKEAKKILKILMSQPHWVYTGVAVIDAATQKTIVDYEKTKLYMTLLSDEEIDRYHRRVSPLDKAGGFDIEGWGGLFIRRIEGCYFNVIGLPLSKLFRMLKKLGVPIMMMLFAVLAAGCATEYNLATEQHESLMYGDEREVTLGAAMASRFDKEFEINTEVDVNERVEAIFKRIVEVCDRKELVYTIKVIDEDKVNAVSLPGGYVYVFKGLIDKVDNDDQLAAVIAHEVGHITARHSVKKIQTIYGYSLAKVISVIAVKSSDLSRGVDATFFTLFTEYSQSDEFQADRLGVKYMKKAGYNPTQMAAMLRILQKAGEREDRPFTYWRTHPYIGQRISAANSETSGQLEFRDYLNLTDENK